MLANLVIMVSRDAVRYLDSGTVIRVDVRKLGIVHRAISLAAVVHVDGLWDNHNINSYHSRLKGWLRKFKGVSTRCLASYFGWFRVIDRLPNTVSNPASFQVLAAGLSVHQYNLLHKPIVSSERLSSY